MSRKKFTHETVNLVDFSDDIHMHMHAMEQGFNMVQYEFMVECEHIPFQSIR